MLPSGNLFQRGLEIANRRKFKDAALLDNFLVTARAHTNSLKALTTGIAIKEENVLDELPF